MAKANVEKETKTEITGVTLELSREEADALAAVVAKIGGDPERSPRKHIKAIEEALEQHDLVYYTSKAYPYLTGVLQFYTHPRNRHSEQDLYSWTSLVF